MLTEIAARIQQLRLRWKPESLEILPRASHAEGFDYEYLVQQEGEYVPYKVVEHTIFLGELFDRRGTSSASMGHRQTVDDNTYFKHRPILQAPGPVIPRIKAWVKSPATVAIHGCENWHVTAQLMQ